MRKGTSLEGLKVIGQSDGTDLGRVRDVVFDYETSRVLALVLSGKELFGLIDAQVVPWSYIREIGPDSIMVESGASIIRAGDDPVVKAEMEREHGLKGREIHTTDGKNLGSFSDIYFQNDGTVVGYEVSGGVFADMSTGRRFMPIPTSFTIGQDVAIVPPEVGHEMEKQAAEEPGGLKAAAASAKDKVADTYSNIASASVDKQKEYVVGKVASRDVMLPAEKTSDELNARTSVENATTSAFTTDAPTSQLTSNELRSETPTVLELNTPTMAGTADANSRGEVVDGEVLVRAGETITREHADRAADNGILHALIASAIGSSAPATAIAGHGASLQENAAEAAIGKTASREVDAPDGTVLVAPGMIITRKIMDDARAVGKEREVIASAGLGAASEGLQSGAATVKEGAGNLFDAAKAKVAELTGAAQDKKAQYDDAAHQKKINNALGRPTTRVILAQDDSVILNTGDLITHKAVAAAEAAGVLDVLLDSVYEADPEITPEMLRAKEPGEAALPTQATPTGGPITATVAPDQPAQDTPSQGLSSQTS
jgi:uncharacterized protein YrrD